MSLSVSDELLALGCLVEHDGRNLEPVAVLLGQLVGAIDEGLHANRSVSGLVAVSGLVCTTQERWDADTEDLSDVGVSDSAQHAFFEAESRYHRPDELQARLDVL